MPVHGHGIVEFVLMRGTDVLWKKRGYTTDPILHYVVDVYSMYVYMYYVATLIACFFRSYRSIDNQIVLIY